MPLAPLRAVARDREARVEGLVKPVVIAGPTVWFTRGCGGDPGSVSRRPQADGVRSLALTIRYRVRNGQLPWRGRPAMTGRTLSVGSRCQVVFVTGRRDARRRSSVATGGVVQKSLAAGTLDVGALPARARDRSGTRLGVDRAGIERAVGRVIADTPRAGFEPARAAAAIARRSEPTERFSSASSRCSWTGARGSRIRWYERGP
jgi:hypothetical protein